MMLPLLLAAVALAQPGERLDTTFAVPSAGRIEIMNPRGDVVVRGWNENRIRVRARHAPGDRAEVRHRNGAVSVRSAARTGMPRAVDYEIDVPTGWSLRVTGIAVGAVVERVRGTTSIETVQGNIRVQDGGTLALTTVQGTIDVAGASGDIVANAVNRGIRISGADGDVVAEAVNGAVVLSDVRGTSVTASTVNGQINFEGPLRRDGTYRLSTHNGDLTLTLAADVGATFRVSTFGGNVQADFPVQVRGAPGGGSLSFALGDAGASVELESFNGAIRLRRAGAR
jgi:DUF4097 and DUF4098 domain-containing protein YvlB